MTFANFITIQYKLLIDRVPSLDWFFGSIWIFAIVFIAIYVPLGIFIGYWHRRNQFSVEARSSFSREQSGGCIMVVCYRSY